MKVAVVGIGNVLMGDEGAGVHALTALQRGYSIAENVDVRLIDGGTMGLDLLPFIEGADRLLLIDAVNAGKKPGELIIVEDQDVPSFLSGKLSAHQIGVPDLLFSARFLDILPRDICLIGVQPKMMEMDMELSPELRAAISPLVDAVIERLRYWGVTVTPRCPADDAEADGIPGIRALPSTVCME